MSREPLPDLDSLDRDALAALILAQQEQLTASRAAQEEELRSLRAELDSHLETLALQSRELESRSEQIARLKLMVDKFRHMMFGRKSEKIVVQLEQMELQLEELEADQAEAESVADSVKPDETVKPRGKRRPLPEHLPREA